MKLSAAEIRYMPRQSGTLARTPACFIAVPFLYKAKFGSVLCLISGEDVSRSDTSVTECSDQAPVANTSGCNARATTCVDSLCSLSCLTIVLRLPNMKRSLEPCIENKLHRRSCYFSLLCARICKVKTEMEARPFLHQSR